MVDAALTDTGATSNGTSEVERWADLDRVLGSLNGEYRDSVLLIARHLGGSPDARDARVVAVDPGGIDLLAATPDAEQPLRVEFPTPLADAQLLTTELFGLVAAARAASGEEGQTSAEVAMQAISGLRTFLTEVVAVADVHPHLRQVTFGGGDLAGFSPLGPDTFLYLLLPPPGRTELTIDRGFSWETVGQMPPDERPVGGYYTLRRWRPEEAELDVLMVLHGDGGPASTWAATAQPGDPAALWGPRDVWSPPADTDRYLLVADETGLPAVAVIVESLPPGTPVHVVAEVAAADEHQELREHPAIEVTWLHRDGAEAGTTTLLVDAVRNLPGLDRHGLYVWGGGESRAMTAVRKYLRREKGFDREAVDLVAYWRHSSHPADPVDDQDR